MKGELQYYTTNAAVVYEMPTPSGIVLMTNHFVVTIPVGQTVQNINPTNYLLIAEGVRQGIKGISIVLMATIIILSFWALCRKCT